METSSWRITWRTPRGLSTSSWISASRRSVSGVVLNLFLNLNGHLHYPAPADIDKPLNEAAADKIRDYRADYNNRPSYSISFMPAVPSVLSFSLSLHRFPHICIPFSSCLQVQELSTRCTTRTTSASAALLFTPSSNLRRGCCRPWPKATTPAYQPGINLNIDSAAIASRAHTHPTHSQASRLLFTSLSLGNPFPRST